MPLISEQGWDFTDGLFAGYELWVWPCSGTPCSNSLDFVSELRAEHRFRSHPAAKTLIPTVQQLCSGGLARPFNPTLEQNMLDTKRDKLVLYSISISPLCFKESDNGSFFIDGKMQTRRDEKDRMILEDVQAILQGMDCTAVEARSAHRRGVLHVVLVIYRRGGVNLDTCSNVYKAVYPRLEMLHPGSEIRLEVSSPGIERNLKSPEEFEIFAGLGVKLLLDEESEWRRGIIVSTSEDSVDIHSGDEMERFLFSSIRRAKLDYLWEA